jgi:hypothetical protein
MSEAATALKAFHRAIHRDLPAFIEKPWMDFDTQKFLAAFVHALPEHPDTETFEAATALLLTILTHRLPR